MKINLETVRHILREALGFDSFVASFITEVKDDSNFPTACISKDGKLYYNPQFVDKYISCTEDLFSLLFHELLHPMFSHYIHGGGQIENIAADAIINAVVSTLYGEQSREGSLFRKIHEPKGIAGLMRPDSRMSHSRYQKVYTNLYDCSHGNGSSLSTGELIQTLKILVPHENTISVLLLGSHGGQSNDGIRSLPAETIARIAEEIRRSARANLSDQAGYSQILADMLMEALRTHLSIRKVLLQKFTTQRKVDRFKQSIQRRSISVSPIPICPSKRDLVMLAVGLYPCHFHNRMNKRQQKDRGLAIYLDVSGSVNDYLPNILGILRNLKREITSIFLFSNQVVEVPFEQLLKGSLRTTWGTDFNCIAQSILERGFDKAIIITDGYACMDEDLQQQLRRHRLSTLTILFDESQECAEFAQFGDTVQLDDLTE
jgi:hypothetical protein